MPDIFVEPQEKKKDHHHKDNHPHADAIQSVKKILETTPNHLGFFAAFAVRPEGVTFANQEPDESILLFVRHHFFTNVPWIFYTLLLSLVPPLLFTSSMIFNVFPFRTPWGLGLALALFYYLIIIGYAFGNFLSWFYNIGIITQKRVTDLDSHNILAHNSATVSIKEIVDVKFTQNGFFQSYFNYGDVHVQTEAIAANFEFLAAPYPTQVTDIISDLRVYQSNNGN